MGRYYARSLGKSQRDEARAKMLEHGFGELVDVEQSREIEAKGEQ